MTVNLIFISPALLATTEQLQEGMDKRAQSAMSDAGSQEDEYTWDDCYERLRRLGTEFGDYLYADHYWYRGIFLPSLAVVQAHRDTQQGIHELCLLAYGCYTFFAMEYKARAVQYGLEFESEEDDVKEVMRLEASLNDADTLIWYLCRLKISINRIIGSLDDD